MSITKKKAKNLATSIINHSKKNNLPMKSKKKK